MSRGSQAPQPGSHSKPAGRSGRHAASAVVDTGRPGDVGSLVADRHALAGGRVFLATRPRMVRLQALKLDAEDRAALGLWAAAHLALLVLAWAAARALRSRREHIPLTRTFEHWDAVLLHNIAQYGYYGPHTIANNTAFFPGYPAVLAACHLLVRNWVVAELLVSGVAGCVAVVALTRLAGGAKPVLYLLAAPAAVFLLVGYAEALFLALAIPAWRAAARGRWWSAALLAGLAGVVRIDAVFLIPALMVMALSGYRGPRIWPPPAATIGRRLANAAKVACAAAGPGAYEIYLWVSTGNPFAWQAALRHGWDIHLATPAQDLRTTWWAAFRHAFSASVAFEFQLELATLVVMVLATIAFAVCRRWPEATYCGLALISLGTSVWFETGPRTALVLFPLWIGFAALGTRRRWVQYAYFSLSGPVAVVLAMLYLSGQWAG